MMPSIHRTLRQTLPYSGFSPSVRWVRSLVLGTASAILTAIPVRAAETIYVPYGPFEFSVSIDALEKFVEDGTIDRNIDFYFRFIDSDTEAELREILGTPHDISPVGLSYAFYDPMGQALLEYLGQFIQTKAGENGLYALRAALVLAAEEPEGLTLIGVLRHFPTEGILLNTDLALSRMRQVTAFVEQTDAVIAQIRALSDAMATVEPPLDLSTLSDLRQPGSYRVEMQTMRLHDDSRDRTFPADLYLPEMEPGADPVPVVVISHGLGSSRQTFADLAAHLASYGFAVAVPEHIGSNLDRQEALLEGRAFEFFDVNEFIDRPLDVTFLLDQLEHRNQGDLQGRLNLNQVGMIGHSFGGYTGLMLAGATIDFDFLDQECNYEALNFSLLLQCRALKFTESDPEIVTLLSEQGLRDDRIQALITLNPVSSIFGEQGISKIQIPVVIAASGYDPATPIVPEQTQTFTWLTTPERYLLLVEGVSHTPELTALVNSVLFSSFDPQETEDEQRLVQSNASALAVAFLKVHLAHQSAFQPYLQASYAQSLSVEPFNISLVRSFTPAQLEQVLSHAPSE